MGASTSVPGMIFCLLAKGFDKLPEAVQEDRKKLAKAMRKFYDSGDAGSDADFNDDDLRCYEQLITLGLAKRCARCKQGYTKWSEDQHGEGECEE